MECQICGAHVYNSDRHATWHQSQGNPTVQWATPLDQMQTLLNVYKEWREKAIYGETCDIMESVWEYCRGLRPVPLGTVGKWSAEWDHAHSKRLYRITLDSGDICTYAFDSIAKIPAYIAQCLHEQKLRPDHRIVKIEDLGTREEAGKGCMS